MRALDLLFLTMLAPHPLDTAIDETAHGQRPERAKHNEKNATLAHFGIQHRFGRVLGVVMRYGRVASMQPSQCLSCRLIIGATRVTEGKTLRLIAAAVNFVAVPLAKRFDHGPDRASIISNFLGIARRNGKCIGVCFEL